MIVRGKNFDPTDLERCLCNYALPSGSNAAIFSTETDSNGLAVACELPRAMSRTLSKTRLEKNITQALSRHFQITPTQTVFCLEFSLPRTSSGKIQRLTCQRLLATSGLRTLPERYFIAADELPTQGTPA